MQKQYHIPGSFDYRKSLLGRLLQRIFRDHLKSESVQILSVITGFVVMITVQYLSWAALSGAIEMNPTGLTAIIFWFVQVSCFLLYLFVTLIGFSSENNIVLDPAGLSILGSSSEIHLPWSEVSSIQIIPSDVYQKHYRKYRKTLSVGSPTVDQVVLLTTDDSPVVVCTSELEEFAGDAAMLLEQSRAFSEKRSVTA